MRRRHPSAFVCMVTAAALLLAGCTGSPHKSTMSLSASGSGSPDASASSVPGVALGAGVRLIASTPPASAKAVVTTGVKLPVAAGTQPLSRTFTLTPSGALPATATISLPLAVTVPVNESVVVATKERVSDSWTYLRATIAADRRHVSFVTRHFSIFSVLGADVGALFKAFKTTFIDVVDGGATASASPPSCDGEAHAKSDGYSVQSSSGKTLYWCLGTDGDKHVLKVVDNRTFPLEVSHPNLKVSKLHYGIASTISHLAVGKNAIITPRDEGDFSTNIPVGSTGSITTQLDGTGQSLYALETGVSTLLEILTKFGFGKSDVEAINVTNDLIGDTRCAYDVTQASPVAVLADCFTPAQLIKYLGVRALILVPLIVFGPLIAFFRSEFDSLISVFNSDDKYTIVIRRSQPAQPFAGSWYVHDAQLYVDSLSAGRMDDYLGFGSCPQAGDDHSCIEASKLRFTLSPDGQTLAATILSKSYHEDSDTGSALPDPHLDGDWTVGDTFTLSFAAPHLMIMKLVHSGLALGNPYWCGRGLATKYQVKCGA